MFRYLLVLLLLSCEWASAQTQFRIDSIAPGRRTMNIWISDVIDIGDLTANNVEVTEQVLGDSDLFGPTDLKVDYVRPNPLDSTKRVIQVFPSSEKMVGRLREITVRWGNYQDTISYRLGTTNVPVYIRQDLDREINTLLNVLVVGLLIVSVLLVILGQLLPVFRKMGFKRKYVLPYREIKVENVIKRDPISGEPFEDDELVVTRCRRVTSLASWKHNGNQCPDYPECMYAGDPCKDAESSVSDERFFDQKGPYRYLNWIWFGSLGGVSAWIVWALLDYVVPWDLLGASTLQRPLLQNLLSEVMLGGGLGLGLTFWLAQVEERSQIRARRGLRILFRSAMGIMVGGLVFGMGYFMVDLLSQGTEGQFHKFILNLPTWLVFGLAIGTILSLWSTVNLTRGIIAGGLASLFSYILYFAGLYNLPESEWGRMISLILMGMLLGAMIVSVIYKKGDFELEIISPAKYKTVIPVNKWLTSGINVVIGASPNVNVFIHWNDQLVAQEHVVLSYQNRQVYLQPISETLVNGKIIPIPQKVELHDGDIIQLGRGGSTKMRFLERGHDHQIDFEYMKKQGKHWPEEEISSKGGNYSPDRPKPSIKITRRKE